MAGLPWSPACPMMACLLAVSKPSPLLYAVVMDSSCSLACLLIGAIGLCYPLFSAVCCEALSHGAMRGSEASPLLYNRISMHVLVVAMSRAGLYYKTSTCLCTYANSAHGHMEMPGASQCKISGRSKASWQDTLTCTIFCACQGHLSCAA